MASDPTSLLCKWIDFTISLSLKHTATYSVCSAHAYNHARQPTNNIKYNDFNCTNITQTKI